MPQGVCWACAAAASSPSSPSPRFWFPEAEGPEETGEVGTGAEEQTGGRVGEQLSTSLGRAAPGTALGSSLFEVPQRAPTNPRTPGAAGSGAHPLPFSVCRAPHPCLALWVLFMGTPAVLRRRVTAWPPAPPPCLQGHAEEGVGDLEGIEVRTGCLVAGSALHDDGCVPECHQPHSKGMHLCTAPVPHFPRMNWI